MANVEKAMRDFERHPIAECLSKRKEMIKGKQHLEKTLLESKFHSENITIVHDTVQTLIFRINASNFRGLFINSDNLKRNASVRTPTRHSMYFPDVLTETVKGKHVQQEMQLVCIYLKASCLFQDEKNSSLLNDDILGATLGNTSIANLRQPVEIRFWHNYTLASSNMTCVFWLEGTEADGLGSWSQEGCKTNTSQEGIVLCQCSHLTYFAVLLQISPTPVDEALLVPLIYITDIGCSVSALACLITICLYVFSRKIQHDSTTKIHMNLLGALFFLNMSFLMGKFLAFIKPPWLCAVAAVFLHYSLLSCLTWMAIEGFHLYMLVIRVYNSYIRRYLLKLCSVGWGFPGLAVLAIVLIKNNSYGAHFVKTSSDRSSSAMCWITAPVINHINLIYFSATILFNMAVLAVVVWKVRQLKANPLRQRKEHSCKDLVTVLGLTCLLGATWTSVFISFGVFSILQMFLFTVLSSLQGLFICLWYCFLRCHSQEGTSWRSSFRSSQ
ncbi:adhesion G-protein coupled receptor G5 [Elgaria multicarinata webbii]|uniref:adhesion G-protein coupled receptor G5 n=1 Tax=Elgaria multicarinata webbii TaxID=159646 RepID=UPI002FCCCAAD